MDLAQFNEQTKGKFTEYAFGQFVRQRRIELGISLKQLSAALDKTPPYISDIEKGKRYAPRSCMESMMNALSIPSSERQIFEDLAAASRGNNYEDINPYLSSSHVVREAIRKARDNDIPEDMWQEFIDDIEEYKKEI